MSKIFSRRTLMPILLAAVMIAGLTINYRQHAADREQTKSSDGYTLHQDIAATIFWVGEPADDSNAQISNVPTAWDDDTTARFGGADGPSTPDGAPSDVPRDSNGVVTTFRPLMNPYYFALPAAEFDAIGNTSEQARSMSPWAGEAVADGYSRFKGKWIKVTSGPRTIYAQWLDVGPNEDDDYAYVFGSVRPKNTFGLKAGLDLSPAAAYTLGFRDDSRQVGWQFVDARDVPDGPWKQYPAIDNKIYW